ncbi:MAG: type I restriction enzyme HsdR N-terminal domain-containing protein [Bacteroidetes bacterium]|nr:type I restriction enzyme HsdR N-terminal domain-containing protein [Bacteroidota bacterium]
MIPDMPIEQSTTWPTEADFEADLQAAISRAFPWLPSGAVRHQTIFSFTWGRATIQVDGREQTKANARADVLLYSRNEPLAVLELKRPGHAINPSDIDQGLSYARMLHPRPPLVVVANGSDDPHLLETHTGSPWKPADPTQSAFASLLSAATHVAADDLKRAVEILMGSNPTVWLQAVRATSRVTLAEMAGDWNDPLRPFVPGFLIPRKAAAVAWALMKDGKRLVFIEGPPLSGKSNVLREITLRADASEDCAVLFIDAEAGVGVC